MSNLASALKRAQAVSGARAAARLYNDLEYELALGAEGSEELYEAGEEALHILERRFPDVARQARQVTDPPRLSRAAGLTLAGVVTLPRRARPAASGRRRRPTWRRVALVALLGELHRSRPRSGWKRWPAAVLLALLALVVVLLVALRLACRALAAVAGGVGHVGRGWRAPAHPARMRLVAPVAPRWPARGRR